MVSKSLLVVWLVPVGEETEEEVGEDAAMRDRTLQLADEDILI